MEDVRLTDGVSRRTLVKGAAWSLPVIAVAAATPLAAASTEGVVEGFSVDGSCGLAGALGPGFVVRAGVTPIPVGTVILVQTSGVLALNLISLSGQGLADITLLSESQIAITLTAPIPAGQQLDIQWLLSVTLLTTTTSTLTLPTGFTPGADTKALGSLRQTLVLCTPS